MNYENIVLVIHLILALCLIGVVLLQRSEGGGLGIGGGGSAATGRPAPTALGKVTWGFAIAFIATSITLTIIAANNASGVSVLDRLTDSGAAETEETLPDLGDSLLPPAPTDSDTLLPPTPTLDGEETPPSE